MNNTIVVSVRAGVFSTPAGDRLLNNVLHNEAGDARDEDLRVLHSLLHKTTSANAPSASEFCERIRRFSVHRAAHDDHLASEFEAMERIRKAIPVARDDTPPRATRSRSRMSTQKATGSAVSETTSIGSVFSRAP